MLLLLLRVPARQSGATKKEKGDMYSIYIYIHTRVCEPRARSSLRSPRVSLYAHAENYAGNGERRDASLSLSLHTYIRTRTYVRTTRVYVYWEPVLEARLCVLMKIVLRY